MSHIGGTVETSLRNRVGGVGELCWDLHRGGSGLPLLRPYSNTPKSMYILTLVSAHRSH